MTKDEALKMAKVTLLKYGSASDELACAIVQTIRCIDEALEQPASSDDIPKGVLQAIDRYGLSLLKTANGFELKKLGKTEALSALEQPAQEPDYWLGYGLQAYDEKPHSDATPVYLHPHQWQGLTDDEIARLVLINEVDKSGDIGFARLIEQALKEKNT